MKSRNVFWGVILVLVGTLFFLKNFDILYFSWRDIFHLWPLVLILIGIAILPVKTTIKLILSALAIIATVIIINASPDYWYSNTWFRWNNWDQWDDTRSEQKWTSQHFSEPYNDKTATAKLDFEAVAGSFKISGITDELFKFEKEGNIGPYESEITVREDEVKVSIGLKGSSIRSGNIKNTVDFSLNTTPIWDLDLDVGAAKFEADLSKHMIRKIKVDGGASAIEIKLGSRYDETEVIVNTGASAVKIYIPEDVACEIETDTFLSSKEMDGFNKVGKDMYVSENFADCEKNISIEIDSAISSFKVIRY